MRSALGRFLLISDNLERSGTFPVAADSNT
jgi:hypothetical protein